MFKLLLDKSLLLQLLVVAVERAPYWLVMVVVSEPAAADQTRHLLCFHDSMVLTLVDIFSELPGAQKCSRVSSHSPLVMTWPTLRWPSHRFAAHKGGCLFGYQLSSHDLHTLSLSVALDHYF